MFKNKFFILIMLAMTSAVLLSAPVYASRAASATLTTSDDDTFLALRDAARNGDSNKAAMLADRLDSYDIASYVDYYRLKSHLNTATVEEIRAFLTHYDGSAIAERLRNDWLLILGSSGDWKNFDEQYSQFVLNDDRQLKCYALLSRAVKGQDVAADARTLLTSPKDYGDACPSLMKTLIRNGQFDENEIDAQVRLAAETASANIVQRIAATAGLSDSLLVTAIDRPNTVLARGPGTTHASRQIFIVALGRAAKFNLDSAVEVLNSASNRLSKDEQALAWAQIAYEASFKLAPEAITYWRKANGASLSYADYQWQVRTALRAGDWKMVQNTIEIMPEKLRMEAVWVYWLGRALKANMHNDEARAQFQSIADQTNFYGQLALEELGGKIVVPPQPLSPTDAELAQARDNQGLHRALKFINLNLRLEGYREWNWELRKMSERQHFAAAEFARQNKVLDRMISTSEHTKIEMDFTQRFPTPYDDLMQSATSAVGLDEAWIYGLIRQESRFIVAARSNVGAQGLMQIMPDTAKFVARKIGIDGFTPSQANEISMNIMLGTNYLNMIYNDLDGSEVLATAAYNAGPGRPRAWRATLTAPVEGAIFTECIPFTETREYVRNVLSNATYYAAMFEHKPQSLKARLGMVAPKGYVASDLP